MKKCKCPEGEWKEIRVFEIKSFFKLFCFFISIAIFTGWFINDWQRKIELLVLCGISGIIYIAVFYSHDAKIKYKWVKKEE